MSVAATRSFSDEYLDWHCDGGPVRVEVQFNAPDRFVKPIQISSQQAAELSKYGKSSPLYLRVDDHGLYVEARPMSSRHMTLVEVNLTEAFLLEQIFGLAFQAMAQRGHLYPQADVSAADKEKWRQRLFALALSLDGAEISSMEDDAYIAFLQNLQTQVNAWPESQAALKDGRWRVGSVQKMVNLWLKYMWCDGRVPPPPHFPVDGVTLQKIPAMKDVRWTQMDSWDQYRTIIQHARRLVGSEPLALWELRTWKSPYRELVSGEKK